MAQVREAMLIPSELIEFLASVPLLQQLPFSALRKMAGLLEVKHIEPFHVLRDLVDAMYIVWDGEIVLTRRPPKMELLKRGDCGRCKELEGAIASKKTSLLVLASRHSSLMSPSSIWTETSLGDETSVCEKLLSLEKIGIDRFRGFSVPNLVQFRQMFGGQLVGQALAAASKSVNPFLLVRSLHCYFLIAGDYSVPVTYEVRRIQDGRTLATRMVAAMQHDKVIFTLSASFQRGENGIEHQKPMPDAPKPEETPSEEDLFKSCMNDSRLPSSARKTIEMQLTKERPLDMRCCDHLDFVEPERSEARQRLWFRAKGKVCGDQALHRCIAAYASDWIFLECALRPHGISTGPDGLLQGRTFKCLTLDHSLWFHKPVKADDWLLFAMESPRASAGRSLVFGHIYNQQGELVISATQEGMFRQSSKL